MNALVSLRGTAVVSRPSAAKKAAAKKAAVAPRAYLLVDPDNYDPDANSGRGSGFVAAPPKGVSVRNGSRPTRVTRGSDGVVYDPDQYDADANVRSAGLVVRPAGESVAAPKPAEGGAPSGGPQAPSGSGPVTMAEVKAAQDLWAKSIVNISRCYLSSGDYVGMAGVCAGELYGYGHCDVLFKPTKAAQFPFRPTAGEAMSYFVGGNAVSGGYDEDHGFAINAGKGFSQVVFDNHKIDLNSEVAIAMGEYHFTCASTGQVSKVEYTFGYKRCADGKVRINLHHSSVPYAPH